VKQDLKCCDICVDDIRDTDNDNTKTTFPNHVVEDQKVVAAAAAANYQ